MVEARWRDVNIPAQTRELARRVLDSAFRVRALGPGYNERSYRRVLAHALRKDGMEAREEVWLGLRFEELVIEDAFRADIIVNGEILVETKAVEQLHPVHGMQVVSYLKASGIPLGYLMNFNVPYLVDGLQRYVHPAFFKRAASPFFDSPRLLDAGEPMSER